MLTIFRLEQKSSTMRELATMLKAGMALGEALNVLEGRTAYPQLRQIIREGARRVAAGGSFSEVLAKYPEEFSELTAVIVEVGEKTGRLDEAFGRIAGYLEREYERRQMLMRETFYPKLILGFCIIFPSLVPAIIAILLGNILGGLWILIKGLTITALILGIPIGLIYLVYKNLAATEQVQLSIDRLKLNLPVFGPLVRRLALAKFARALADAYSAGVPMDQAVELAAGVTGNRVLQRRLKGAVPLIQQGHKLSDAVTQLPDIDEMVKRMLLTGEQTGELDMTMNRVAEHFETATATSIHRLAVLSLPLGVIFVGIIVGYMVISFYMEYYSGF